MVERHRLIVEGYNCTAEMSQGLVLDFLLNLTETIKMNYLDTGQQNPGCCYVGSETGLKPGYSGWVFWTESGGQLHNWEEDGFITLDMFSCKYFEPAKVEELFREYFNPEKVAICVPVLKHCE